MSGDGGGPQVRLGFGGTIVVVIVAIILAGLGGQYFLGINIYSGLGISSKSIPNVRSFPDIGTFDPKPGSVAGVKAQVPAGMKPCDRVNAKANQLCKFAKNYAGKEVNSKTQLLCLDDLWDGESGWDPTKASYNPEPTSGGHAYGIPQALDRLHNYPYKYDDWKSQVDWGLHYIKGTYNSPCVAWGKWLSRSPHWY
jgi:hypothetical protein